ncbi:MAG: hypothetical protein ACUVRO_07765, partial [Armatimonadota bacterium]
EQAASLHDYTGFYTQEILFRKELWYPPYSRLANVMSADAASEAAQGRARAAADALRAEAEAAGLRVQILGPAPAPIERLKGRYRWHVLVKAAGSRELSACLDVLDRLPNEVRAGIVVDVDPVSVL